MKVTAEVLDAALAAFVNASEAFAREPGDRTHAALLRAADKFRSADRFFGVESDDDPDELPDVGGFNSDPVL